MLIEGDGLASVGMFNGVITDLLTQFPVAGLLTPIPVYFQSQGGFGGAASPYMDTNWHNHYTLLPAVGSYNIWTVNLPWNVLELDYIAFPNGSTFKLQTNAAWNGVMADTGFTVNAYNATRTGKSAFWTNSAAMPWAFQVVQISSSGSNIIANPGIYNTDITNGIIVGLQAGPASDGPQFNLLVDAVVWTPIYTTWEPDMIIYESISGMESGAPNPTSVTDWPQLFSFWRSCSPSVDLVLCGIYPVTTTGDLGDQANNQVLLTNAIYFNGSYFDGYTPFVSPMMTVARGYAIPGNVHYTPSGMAAYRSICHEVLESAMTLHLAILFLLAAFTLRANGGWVARPFTTLNSIALSADGTKLFAGPQFRQLYIATSSSTLGTVGYLQGIRDSAIELQHIGNGQFIPLSHEGDISAH